MVLSQSERMYGVKSVVSEAKVRAENWEDTLLWVEDAGEE